MDQLWRRCRQGDANARQQIITSYAHLTRYVVDRMNIRPTAVLGYEDLLSDGGCWQSPSTSCRIARSSL